MARQHGTRQPAPGHRDGTTRSPASYPTRAKDRQSSEVWCRRRGSEESGTNAPFWPGACATRLQHAAPFGSWLQGPGVNLQRATAMKPWKTSFALISTDARPSFRLDPQWSGYGPVLPEGTSRKPGTGSDPAKPPLTICNRAISFMLVSKPLHSISQAREPVSLWLSCPRWLGSDSRGSHRPRSPHLSEQGTDNSERFSP